MRFGSIKRVGSVSVELGLSLWKGRRSAGMREKLTFEFIFEYEICKFDS